MARRGDIVTTYEGCQPFTNCQDSHPTVFVANIGIHTKTMKNVPHTFAPILCPIHTTPLMRVSNTVFASNLGVGRKGDKYLLGEEITTVLQSTVFAGG